MRLKPPFAVLAVVSIASCQPAQFPQDFEVKATIDRNVSIYNEAKAQYDFAVERNIGRITLSRNSLKDCSEDRSLCLDYEINQREGNRFIGKIVDSDYSLVCETGSSIACYQVMDEAPKEALAKPQDFFPGKGVKEKRIYEVDG